MAEVSSLTSWICNIDIINGMPLEDVKISEVFDAGIIINEEKVLKFIPWSAISVITKTGSYQEDDPSRRRA